jgi:hypothetical protein
MIIPQEIATGNHTGWYHHGCGGMRSSRTSMLLQSQLPVMAVLPQARHFLWRYVAEDARYDRLLRRLGLIGAG